MKIEYLQSGAFRFVVEDGRDAAWLTKLAESIKEPEEGDIDKYFSFSADGQDLVDAKLIVEDPFDLTSMDFHPFRYK